MADNLLEPKNNDEPSYDVLTATEDGYPVRRRVTHVDAAQSLYERMKTDDEAGDASRRAWLKGMINGEPPYDEEELRQLGLANITNVNFMVLRANLDARAASGHELFVDVPSLIEITPRGLTGQTLIEANSWSQAIAEEWTRVVRSWRGFLPAMDLMWRDSDAYGLGVGIFDDPWDWRIKAIHRGSVFVLPDAKVALDENDIICVESTYSVNDLFRFAEAAEASNATGWNAKEIRKLLGRLKSLGSSSTYNDREYGVSNEEAANQRRMNNDAAYQLSQFDTISVRHLFIREAEADGKISHMIFARDCADFLYKKYDEYKTMTDVFWWLPYTFGDGYIRSVRGVASYMAQHEDLNNRTLCHAFDSTFLSSSLILQPRSTMGGAKADISQVGPFTLLAPEYDAIQTSFAPRVGDLLQINAVSENVMQNKTGTWSKFPMNAADLPQKTAAQVANEQSHEARFEKAEIALRLQHFDMLYATMLERMLRKGYSKGKPGGEFVEDFISAVLARGVPEEYLRGIGELYTVRSYRAIGFGSIAVKLDITQQLLNASGMLDSAGRKQALFEWVAARVGYASATRFVAPVDRDQLTVNETSIAVLEWNDATEGHEVVVGEDQNHIIHCTVFMQKLQQIAQHVQAVSQAGPNGPMAGQVPKFDPDAYYRAIQAGTQHIQQHVSVIQNDQRYQQFVEQVVQFIQQVVAPTAKALEQVIAQRDQMLADQQAEQQALVEGATNNVKTMEAQAKLEKTRSDIELAARKLDSLNEMRRMKTEEQLSLNREKAYNAAALQREKLAADIALKQNESQAEIVRKDIESQAKRLREQAEAESNQ